MTTTHLALRPFSRSRSAGILGRANARNRNGRVYPKNLLEREAEILSLIHISEPTRPLYISYAVFCL